MRVGALFAGYGGLEMAVQAVWPHANVSRVAQLKMLGNGVVSQQAALALRLLTADEGAS